MIDFLQGLFDASGGCSLDLNKGCLLKVSFKSFSRSLCEGIQNLLLKFNIFSSISENRTTYSVDIKDMNSIYYFKDIIDPSQKFRSLLSYNMYNSFCESQLPIFLSTIFKFSCKDTSLSNYIESNTRFHNKLVKSSQHDMYLIENEAKFLLEGPISNELRYLINDLLQYRFAQVIKINPIK